MDVIHAEITDLEKSIWNPVHMPHKLRAKSPQGVFQLLNSNWDMYQPILQRWLTPIHSEGDEYCYGM